MSSNVNSILVEAVADLVRAFSYETNAYLKTASAESRNKLHQGENWKPIFDKVAQRYIEDMEKRGLDVKKRLNPDMAALLRTTRTDDKYLTLLKNRKEIQEYLKKQILSYKDEGVVRVLKYRNPTEFENSSKQIKDTTPTPKLTKYEQRVKDAEVDLNNGKDVKKVGSQRHFGGLEFERKVAKALASDKYGEISWDNKKVSIELPGETYGIANKIYEKLQKNPDKNIIGTIKDEDIVALINEIDFNTENMAKHDFEFDGKKYEIKKSNIYNASIFCEIWKVATKKSLSKLVSVMGSEEKAQMFYNNFINRVSLMETFKTRLLSAVRKTMIKNNINIIALCGSLSSKTQVGIFTPNQLEFSLNANKKMMGTRRLTVEVKAREGEKPAYVLGSYGELKESLMIDNITNELLLRE